MDSSPTLQFEKWQQQFWSGPRERWVLLLEINNFSEDI
jgi:hypothetical protein